jgi:glycosyltransferase involved in cell wall biosynthesis
MAIAIDEGRIARLILPSKPRVSVIIPAMNEARNLPYVLPRVPTWVYEVILVDGHSHDDTVAVARAFWPTIRIIPQEGRGKGAALRTGFAAATGEIIVMLDADGSADACEIERFVDALLSGADFAKGTRYVTGGGSADITGFRSLGNRVLGHLVNMLFGVRYTDLCYGYNAFWTYCLPHMQVDCDGFEVETQINIRIAQAGLNVREVPSFEGKRIHGVSNLNAFRDGWRVLKTITREWRRPRARDERYGGVPRWEVLRGEMGDAGLGTKTN